MTGTDKMPSSEGGGVQNYNNKLRQALKITCKKTHTQQEVGEIPACPKAEHAQWLRVYLLDTWIRCRPFAWLRPSIKLNAAKMVAKNT